MKNFILLFAALFVLSNYAKADVFKVQGRLIDDIRPQGRINKLIFTENKREIKLVNEYVESESCNSGLFEIQKVAPGKFKLVNIIECDQFVDETQEIEFCPENFMPVCGEVMDLSCLNGGCQKSLPEIKTFSNSCELYKSKAFYVHEGECK